MTRIRKILMHLIDSIFPIAPSDNVNGDRCTRLDGPEDGNRSLTMSPQLRGEIRQEADLIARFAQTYRRRFSELIERMNRTQSGAGTPGAEAAPDPASLRLC